MSEDGKTGDGMLRFWAWDGFSATNLNKLLSKSSDPTDYGVVPAVHLDLREIPAAGSSGVIKMVVSVLEGDDDSLQAGAGTSALEAKLNWALMAQPYFDGQHNDEIDNTRPRWNLRQQQC